MKIEGLKPMAKHAKFSASSAHRWVPCPGSIAMCKKAKKTDNEFSMEGTAAHSLGELALTRQARAIDFLGHRCPDTRIKFTKAMCDDVQIYVDEIHDYLGFDPKPDLLVEERVDYFDALFPGKKRDLENTAFGTSDAIILYENEDELQVDDLKFGRGVKVDADNNEQMMLYAIGAKMKYSAIANFKTARLVIHQPRLKHLSEWSVTVEELDEFAKKASAAANMALEAEIELGIMPDDKWQEKYLHPGPKQCQWCPKKGTCPRLANFAASTMTGEMEDLDALDITEARLKNFNVRELTPDQLALLMPLTPLFEGWCKSIRGAVEAHLFAGEDVPGFKIVKGRKGKRRWFDSELAEDLLKAMRLKDENIYKYTLISPTDAQKLLKKKNPRRWAKLQKLITRSDGQPHVAPVDDKRAALVITPVADEFEDLTALA